VAPPGAAGSSPAGGPVPAGFQPASFTAVSATEWWLLGDTACSHQPCTSVVRTTDGGITFVALPAPTAALVGGVSDPNNGHGVRELRFADTADGFAFGPDLWATHDGGGHWHPVPLPGQVTALAAADGDVFAVAAGALYRASAATDAWSRLAADHLSPDALALHGADVVTQTAFSDSSPSRLLVSHDHGAHFSAYSSPDVGLGCTYDEPVAAVIWALCTTGTESALTRSTDGGVTFPPLSHDQQFVNSAQLGAASSTTAVVTGRATGGGALNLTTDGGRTFQPTGPALPAGGGWGFIGFTDATHGAAVATTGLYRTGDGGHTWKAVAF
jgi:hypothetical protein